MSRRPQMMKLIEILILLTLTGATCPVLQQYSQSQHDTVSAMV